MIERVSPTSGEVVSREEAHDLNACLRFAAQAASAFPDWSAMGASERAQLLINAADLLDDRIDMFSATIVAEIAAPKEWARHNVTFAAEILREVASYHDTLDTVEMIPDRNGVISRAMRTPCGVVLGIAPWNAPLVLAVRAIAAPLLCGNTVLLKGNEFAPRTFRLFGELLRDAGIPSNVARVFLNAAKDSEPIVDALIASPVVRRVNFTGSTRVGRRVAELCAKHLKRPLLELGGQATMLVLEDADLDRAAKAALRGAFLNQGQICMSTERLVVAEAVADKLVARIEAGRKQLKLGDPAAMETDVGPVVSTAAAERLSGLISDAVSKGARLVGGGGIRDAFVEPTLLDHVEPEMRVFHEEVFGPILSVTRVANDLEAITVANDSEYGLASAVFSNDPARAERIAQQIHSGICHINRATVDDNPHAPFGGVKLSGYGRFGGRWALNEFTELRWVTSVALPDD
ncbi:aldehyde dehydrogenase [Actibacterium lipolyticum]|uniref:Vanillin dehydrogenase n=1 Tax=Actibacterium lipolyticum TaxID=1524263 RepID=A0A238KT73_9RHOB|nr:aldehyde dehydrogenase [Actibacterium lipolyticum]SMX45928.1 Vanillin dehydrogenase [Actibacterium lipolyticum]